MRKYLPFAIVGAVALATLVSANFLYRAKRLSRAQPSINASAAEGDRQGEHALGPKNAAVTIDEYGDFQCPPCGTLAEPLDQMVKELQPDLRLVYHNCPLPVHANARQAALVAEAAGLQGKFWEMHDLLYREQAVWSKAINVQPIFNTYANTIGLDTQRFALDVASEKTNDIVEKDERRAKSLNVKNTPTLFLNDVLVAPKDLNPSRLHQLIIETLQSNKKP